ncbi:unnamed protein product, partial [Prorocentrum cordatum]
MGGSHVWPPNSSAHSIQQTSRPSEPAVTARPRGAQVGSLESPSGLGDPAPPPPPPSSPRSPRAGEDYFVTSKIPGGLNATATVASLELSLRQLGLDYVDLMLIHFPATMDAQMAGGRARRQEEWKALQEWAKQGKARSVGVSHYCRRQFQDVLDVATVPVAVNQVQYHVGMGSAGRNATDDFDFFQSIGTVFESFSPLCG